MTVQCFWGRRQTLLSNLCYLGIWISPLKSEPHFSQVGERNRWGKKLCWEKKGSCFRVELLWFSFLLAPTVKKMNTLYFGKITYEGPTKRQIYKLHPHLFNRQSLVLFLFNSNPDNSNFLNVSIYFMIIFLQEKFLFLFSYHGSWFVFYGIWIIKKKKIKYSKRSLVELISSKMHRDHNEYQKREHSSRVTLTLIREWH